MNSNLLMWLDEQCDIHGSPLKPSKFICQLAEIYRNRFVNGGDFLKDKGFDVRSTWVGGLMTMICLQKTLDDRITTGCDRAAPDFDQ